jgi:hypothetical protein
MNTIVEDCLQVGGGCERPDISGRLYAYLDDPINEPSADDIEEHLLGCRDCREFLLMGLKLRRAGREAQVANSEEIAGSAEVVSLADFRKEYP